MIGGNQKKSRQRGFTMIEVLVVLAIFTTVVVTISDLFIISLRAERRVEGQERLAAESRVAVETVIRAVRDGSIAYDIMGEPLLVREFELVLRDPSGTIIRFSKSGDSLQIEEDAESAPLTSDDVRLVEMKFYISPDQDPFVLNPATGEYAVDAQPRVTMVLVLESKSNGQTLVVQATATTRQYLR